MALTLLWIQTIWLRAGSLPFHNRWACWNGWSTNPHQKPAHLAQHLRGHRQLRPCWILDAALLHLGEYWTSHKGLFCRDSLQFQFRIESFRSWSLRALLFRELLKLILWNVLGIFHRLLELFQMSTMNWAINGDLIWIIISLRSDTAVGSMISFCWICKLSRLKMANKSTKKWQKAAKWISFIFSMTCRAPPT